jgi:DNA-directed RNA polymerase subunit RPC12/RpoP
MGIKSSYKCPDCGYKVTTSAGPDRGMIAATDTFVCQDCEIVQDILIKKYRNFDDSSVDENIIISCNKCGGSNLIKWDNEKKPCPRFAAKLKQDKSGLTFYWD